MKILVVYAHPQPDSLTGALKDVAVQTLRDHGHQVQVSDLYEMKWRAEADMSDFGAVQDEPRFMFASGEAYQRGELAPEIVAEQQKLLWADAVLFHFPLWWFSMPAIMKGWIDRVFTLGFAYGAGGQAIPRYGDGKLAGRQAMLVVTVGGKSPNYADRGINGRLEDLLFPIHHGTLFYPGMEVLPPFAVHGTLRVSSQRYEEIAEDLRERLSRLDTLAPIPFRTQDGGDYQHDTLTLKPGLEAPGTQGFALHTANG